MIRNLFLFVAALVLLSICSSPVRAAEITLNWRMMTGSNMNSDSSKIYDMEFMPEQESFIIVTGSSLQVRDCEDGTIIKSVSIPYIGAAHNIEFTPDSTKLILAYADKIEMREIENFTIINSYTIPKDEEEFSVRFIEMKVDPFRPFIYSIQNRQKYVNGNLVIYRKILIFNSENLEPVGELMPQTDLLLYNLAVSKDGKYLAVMNAGYTSKLMVWSLDTRQQIIDKAIGNSGKEWSDPADVKFSEINSDKIYFTGAYYREFSEENFGGLCIFSISQNKIVDSTYSIGVNASGIFSTITFYNDKLLIGGYMIKFINQKDMSLEYERVYDENDNYIFASNAIFNEKNNFFLGRTSGSIDKFQYQPNTSVPLDNKKEVIYPNPTTGFVNISINCQSTITYKIFDINGILLKSNHVNDTSVSNLLTIDCSDLSKGVYTIQIICDKNIVQYQLVKGE